VCSDSIGPKLRLSRSDQEGAAHSDRSVTLRLEGFAWESIDEEAAREGVTPEELIAFSVLYYLADVDSERISRRISRSPYPGLLRDRSDA
jgi:hypothetical protein